MKTLIINGSPRPHGNTAYLIEELKKHLNGEIIELSAFRSNIAPCVDCRDCWETAKCVIQDEMRILYEDDFDNVVFASPVYFGTMPGKMLSMMSRMQPWHAATFFLKKPLVQKKKRAAAILTAGGKKNHDKAHHHLYAFCKLLNAHELEDHVVCSGETDTISAWEDEKAVKEVVQLAKWLNEQELS